MKKSINIGLILFLLFQACSSPENTSEIIENPLPTDPPDLENMPSPPPPGEENFPENDKKQERLVERTQTDPQADTARRHRRRLARHRSGMPRGPMRRPDAPETPGRGARGAHRRGRGVGRRRRQGESFFLFPYCTGN